MSSKFAALAANVSQAFKVELIDPVSDAVIKDKGGKVSFIEVYSIDSEAGRKFDKDQRAIVARKSMRSRNGIVEPTDQLELNVAKCAALTKSWHLVDPANGEVIDVPCNAENAAELYSAAGTSWLFVQAWVGANETANFIKRSSTTSTSSPSMTSERADG